MQQFEQWQIWKAKVVHDDNRGFEERPVVIISEEEMIVLSLKVTTHGHSGKVRPFEYEIMKWKEAGLDKGSVVQCEKYHKIPKEYMTNYYYGRLSAADIVMLQAMMKYHGLA